MNAQPILDYISANWDRSIYTDSNGSGFRGIDIPFPYSSPCIKGEGKFFFFFYWDTYFTNLGLLRAERFGIAKDNIKNMLWYIKREGYMPNHVGIENRSQPPYLCRMVREYIAASGDDAFLAEAADGLRAEYHFWAVSRHTPTGLQRHGQHDINAGCEEFYSDARVLAQGNSLDAPIARQREVGAHFIAEAETGWDFTQRFDSRCLDFNAVDLNGLLYEYETYLSEVSKQLDWGDSARWKERAAKRVELVAQYLWNEEQGLFFDYDFVNDRQSEVASLAAMLPLFSGLATAEQAERVRQNLPLFEREHGVAVTDEREGCRDFQWAFPNVWPPLVYVTVEGLRRYGFEADARRIAQKYVNTTITLFEQTGQLWEKTDSENGNVAGGEYDAAPMLGWSAGVFIALVELLEQ